MGIERQANCAHEKANPGDPYCPSCGKQVGPLMLGGATDDGWVSVEERLPEPGCDVFAVVKYDDGHAYRDIAHFDSEQWVIGGQWWTDTTVTHWRRLPPLPVAEVEG